MNIGIFDLVILMLKIAGAIGILCIILWGISWIFYTVCAIWNWMLGGAAWRVLLAVFTGAVLIVTAANVLHL